MLGTPPTHYRPDQPGIARFLEPMADDLAVGEQVRALREKAEQLKAADYDASTRKHMRTMNFQSRRGRRQN